MTDKGEADITLPEAPHPEIPWQEKKSNPFKRSLSPRATAISIILAVIVMGFFAYIFIDSNTHGRYKTLFYKIHSMKENVKWKIWRVFNVEPSPQDQLPSGLDSVATQDFAQSSQALEYQKSQKERLRKVTLIRESSSGEETVFVGAQGTDNTILKWKNYIFYSLWSDETITLYSHNLNTGETRKIYDLDDYFPKSNHSRPNEISYIKVIEDTLYFSVGGYLLDGGLYFMKLPPTGKFAQLQGVSNPEIKEENGYYWIIGGEGDACWYKVSYSTLDIKTNKVTKVADIDSGCGEGETKIGIDSKKRMLIYGYKSPDGSSNPMNTHVTYVYGVHIANPSINDGIISKEDMPKGITAVNYLEQSESLLLTGDKNYTLNLKTNKMELLDLTPPPTPTVKNTYQPEKSKTFSETLEALDLPSNYRVEVEK